MGRNWLKLAEVGRRLPALPGAGAGGGPPAARLLGFPMQKLPGGFFSGQKAAWGIFCRRRRAGGQFTWIPNVKAAWRIFYRPKSCLADLLPAQKLPGGSFTG